jgi:hypothetical protein
MRRPSKVTSKKLSGDSLRLVSLAQSLVQAGSRLEERDWERRIDMLAERLLKNDRQAALDAALDHLFKSAPEAYDILVESIETVSISCVIEHDEHRFDAMLVAVPILAWTRFSIASGPISADTVLTLSAHLYGHVLASDTRIAMLPYLFAIDQLPRTHSDVFALTRHMANAALTERPMHSLTAPPQTAPFLADIRYLLAAIVAPSGGPLFRWQMPEAQLDGINERQQTLSQWRMQAMPTIEKMLPGCGIELLLPEAYYAACREADKRIRPASIHASVHYLTHTLNVAAEGLSVIVGGFAEELTNGRIDEYRISFTLYRQPEVLYGVVWPLYEDEEAEDEPRGTLVIQPTGQERPMEAPPSSPLEEIYALLRQSGVTDIRFHNEVFLIESCEDCGAPLYCDQDAELTHAEMPDDIAPTTEHFH